MGPPAAESEPMMGPDIWRVVEGANHRVRHLLDGACGSTPESTAQQHVNRSSSGTRLCVIIMEACSASITMKESMQSALGNHTNLLQRWSTDAQKIYKKLLSDETSSNESSAGREDSEGGSGTAEARWRRVHVDLPSVRTVPTGRRCYGD